MREAATECDPGHTLATAVGPSIRFCPSRLGGRRVGLHSDAARQNKQKRRLDAPSPAPPTRGPIVTSRACLLPSTP